MRKPDPLFEKLEKMGIEAEVLCPRCGEMVRPGLEPDGCEDRECPMWESNQ